jgi:hypothetical protein
MRKHVIAFDLARSLGRRSAKSGSRRVRYRSYPVIEPCPTRVDVHPAGSPIGERTRDVRQHAAEHEESVAPDVRPDPGGHQCPGSDRARWTGVGVFARQPRSGVPFDVPRLRYESNRLLQNYQRWSQTSLDTTLGALRAAGLQNQQMQSEQSVVNSLENMSQTADGQMQALNVLGQISDQQVQQLMKLRELMMADMSSKQAYQAAMIQQQAADQAAAQWFFTGGPVTSDGKTYLPGQ